MIEQWSAGWGAGVIGILLLSLLALGVLLYKYRQNDERRLIQGVHRYSSEVIRDAILPDGIDGYLFADYLLHMGDQIVVLNFELRKGYIFGAANIDEWTCVENNRTGKFINPLKRTSLFVQQCRHIAEFEGIQGYVLFASTSEFPKGVPEGVLEMTRFEATLGSLSGGDGDRAAIDLAWTKLKTMNQESEQQINSNL